MLDKKIMLLAIFLVGLLAVSAASAADNTTNDDIIPVGATETVTGDVGSADGDDFVQIDNEIRDENVLNEGEGKTHVYIDVNISESYVSKPVTAVIQITNPDGDAGGVNVNANIIDSIAGTSPSHPATTPSAFSLARARQPVLWTAESKSKHLMVNPFKLCFSTKDFSP